MKFQFSNTFVRFTYYWQLLKTSSFFLSFNTVCIISLQNTPPHLLEITIIPLMAYQSTPTLKSNYSFVYFQYPCLYCWWRIPKYIIPYPEQRTVTTPAATTGTLNGGSKTVFIQRDDRHNAINQGNGWEIRKGEQGNTTNNRSIFKWKNKNFRSFPYHTLYSNPNQPPN